jgi:hypothetical protein
MSSLKLKLDFSRKTCYTESVRFVNKVLPTFYWNAVYVVWKVF